MSDLVWASALSPQEPFKPRARHWAAGVAAMIGCTAAAAVWYASLDHSIESLGDLEEERLVVALGGSAPRRIDAPPKALQDAPVSDPPYVVAERAKDAAPIAPPPEARPVAQWSDGEGRLSSGTGGAAQAPSPPAPPAPPPPPKPKPQGPVGLGGKFAEVSTVRYASLIVYPPASLRQEEEGLGILAVVIKPDGRVVSWSLEKSTGWQRLDQEIERVARKVKRLDPLPAGFTGKVAVVRVPINFKIEDDY